MKIICSPEYLFLEARRLCEAVQMSAKTQRPAPSDDIGYLDVCFLYFNCAELVLPTWPCWPLGAVRQDPCASSETSKALVILLCYFCASSRPGQHTYMHTHPSLLCTFSGVTPTGGLFREGQGWPQLSHNCSSTFIKGPKEQKRPPHLS